MTMQANIELGKSLSEVVLDLTQVAAQMASPEHYAHVTMVALLHAAIRAEVQSRAKGGWTASQYRAAFHELADEIMTGEERRFVALK